MRLTFGQNGGLFARNGFTPSRKKGRLCLNRSGKNFIRRNDKSRDINKGLGLLVSHNHDLFLLKTEQAKVCSFPARPFLTPVRGSG